MSALRRYDLTGEPIDFSFMEMETFQDLASEDPVAGLRIPVEVVPQTSSEKQSKKASGSSGSVTETNRVLDTEDGGEETKNGSVEDTPLQKLLREGTPGYGKGVDKSGNNSSGVNSSGGDDLKGGRSSKDTKKIDLQRLQPLRLPACIRLNNNKITSCSGLGAAFTKIFYTNWRTELLWIDLSFNEISVISSELLECTALKVLNLHANQIRDKREVAKLKALKHLRKLTLHGNPLEEALLVKNKNNYRNFVVSTVPHIKEFDFCAVTKKDREKALTWRKMKDSAIRNNRRK